MSNGDKGYFNSYARFGIHHEMLSDRIRTEGYQKFLENNPSLLKGKVVLDIGCGTGILSMFAARAGAKRVIGIDMSEIVFDAQKIVEENGLSDVITLIRGVCAFFGIPAARCDHHSSLNLPSTPTMSLFSTRTRAPRPNTLPSFAAVP